VRDDPLTPAQRALLEKLRDDPDRALAGFYLAGGSGLAIRLKHRRSLDHDFFRQEVFTPTVLRETLARVCGPLTPLQLKKGTLSVRIGDVKASFFQYPYPLLEAVETIGGLFPTAGLLDIALMKLTAIADRGLRKDFIDLYAILQAGVRLEDVFARLPDKFPGADYQVYAFRRALTYFEDATDEPLDLLSDKLDWAEIQRFFLREVARLPP